MTVQANGAAVSPGAGLGFKPNGFDQLHAVGGSRTGASARAKSLVKGRNRGITALLTGALLASAATPIMVAADLSGAVVAAPLFLAGIAVAAASLISSSSKTSETPIVEAAPCHDGSAATALPLADLFEAAAFVVTPAGAIVEANNAGKALSSDLASRYDPPVLFDLLDADGRVQAMAALSRRGSGGVEVRLRNGNTKRLHIVSESEKGLAIAVLSAPVDSITAVEPRSGTLSEAMLATVSHELRTPLNAIIGFSGILENELFGKLGSERQREYVGLIQSSGRHLLSVVNQILDVSKIEAGAYQLQCEHFLLDEVVEEASAMVRCQAEEKGIAFAIEGPGGGTMIHGDRRALHHMLVNLLANAVKFTDNGSVTLYWQRDGRDLKLSVSDTGIGIPADQIGKLGVPFVQASCGLTRKYEGTGLGLAYVRGMSELHGGTMMITSQEGEGTKVTLDLPLVPRQATDTDNQNIVALNHARKPHNQDKPNAEARRTA